MDKASTTATGAGISSAPNDTQLNEWLGMFPLNRPPQQPVSFFLTDDDEVETDLTPVEMPSSAFAGLDSFEPEEEEQVELAEILAVFAAEQDLADYEEEYLVVDRVDDTEPADAAIRAGGGSHRLGLCETATDAGKEVGLDDEDWKEILRDEVGRCGDYILVSQVLPVRGMGEMDSVYRLSTREHIPYSKLFGPEYDPDDEPTREEFIVAIGILANEAIA